MASPLEEVFSNYSTHALYPPLTDQKFGWCIKELPEKKEQCIWLSVLKHSIPDTQRHKQGREVINNHDMHYRNVGVGIKGHTSPFFPMKSGLCYISL